MRKVDPYVIGHKLLSIDLQSVSLAELSILEYACSCILADIDKEFDNRGVNDAE